MQNQTKILVC